MRLIDFRQLGFCTLPYLYICFFTYIHYFFLGLMLILEFHFLLHADLVVTCLDWLIKRCVHVVSLHIRFCAWLWLLLILISLHLWLYMTCFWFWLWYLCIKDLIFCFAGITLDERWWTIQVLKDLSCASPSQNRESHEYWSEAHQTYLKICIFTFFFYLLFAILLIFHLYFIYYECGRIFCHL